MATASFKPSVGWTLVPEDVVAEAVEEEALHSVSGPKKNSPRNWLTSKRLILNKYNFSYDFTIYQNYQKLKCVWRHFWMTHQEASTSGSPLIFVGDDDNDAEKETSVDKWPGMKPSQCWIDNGISQVQGSTSFLNNTSKKGSSINDVTEFWTHLSPFSCF